jgi:hypothetical protein
MWVGMVPAGLLGACIAGIRLKYLKTTIVERFRCGLRIKIVAPLDHRLQDTIIDVPTFHRIHTSSI